MDLVPIVSLISRSYREACPSYKIGECPSPVPWPSILRIHPRSIYALHERIPDNNHTPSERVEIRNGPRQSESSYVTALSHAGRTAPDYLPLASYFSPMSAPGLSPGFWQLR